MKAKKRVLIAPLDWGLGHASRCIPIVNYLREQHAEVILAGSGASLQLLQREFPDLPTRRLPAYNIRYPFSNMYLNISLQFFHIAITFLQELFAIRRLVRQERPDLIISDNRFGLAHSACPSVVLSHQMFVHVSPSWLGRIVNGLHHFILRRYDACWIPDLPPPHSLAGKLSVAPSGMNARYIGILSPKKALPENNRWDAVAILSGPEPQRSRLEKHLRHQLQQLPGNYLIVQGLPNLTYQETQNENCTVITALTAEGISEVMAQAAVVISRSGYSTIMDLAMTHRKAILIPTPGQTEQEYLADYFMEKGIFYTQSQQALHVKSALREVQGYSGLSFKEYGKQDLLADAIQQYLRPTIKT